MLSLRLGGLALGKAGQNEIKKVPAVTESRQRGVRWTIFGVVVYMALVVASFIHRVGEPRIMSLAETRANGLFLFDTPRDAGDFALIDQRGA